ncbi:fatty acid desaturase family protein [Amnibacterium endophyticum]|uniref:Fatty acid desaturase family protein n=1 Tax=Amnibacterium endophyticum TaxID=2109337 RepID=A0ABW4LBE5_9MICO
MSTTAPPAVRTTRPRRVAPGGAQAAHASEYAELSRRIKAAGLLERRYGPYLVRSLLIVLALGAGIAAVVLLGHSWWQLAVAVWFGAVFAQAGFLAHDGAHRQVFASGRANEWFSRVVANLVVGLGYGWWMHKHTRHHGNPNTLGKDTDMDPNLIVFTPEDAASRRGPAAFLMRHQGWFFLPAMTLTGLDLHAKTLRMVLGRGEVKQRPAEIAFLAVRLIGFPLLLVLAAGPVIGLSALVVQLLAFGFLMGGAFAPNHIGMPLIDHAQRVDYLRRQVLTSRNINGGRLVDIAMGGLNHQIEHHLFPSMPSANLRRGRAMIRDYCAEIGVPYLERTLPVAMRDVIRSVHRVGIRHADPFDCPAAAALRLA